MTGDSRLLIDDDDDDDDFDENNSNNGDVKVADESKLERLSRGKWTPKEDEVLKFAVTKHGGRNWKRIADYLEGRSDVQCLHRWQKVLRPGLVKGPWTKEVC